ncbi:hypothetical protein MMPV_006200 [Pyropia vietnamensis]
MAPPPSPAAAGVGADVSRSPRPAVAYPPTVLIGAGAWGTAHLRTLSRLGALAAVVDPSPAARNAAVAATAPTPVAVFETLDDALRGGVPGGLTAAVVATPPARHAVDALAALAAGLATLVEKPLAVAPAEAVAVVDAAEAAAGGTGAAGRGDGSGGHAGRGRLVLRVGHLTQYMGVVVAAANAVRAGRLGRLLRVAAVRRNWGTFRTAESALWSLAPHDVAVGLGLLHAPRPGGEETPDGWAAGGIVTCTGHAGVTPGVVDVAHVEVAWPGTAAAVAAAVAAAPSKGGVGDNTVADADAVADAGDFAGSRLTIDVSWAHPVKERTTTLTGTAGVLVIDELAAGGVGTLTYYAHTAVRRGGIVAATTAQPVVLPLPSPGAGGGSPLEAELREFLGAVAGVAAAERPRAAAVPDGAQGLAVVRVLAAAQASLDGGGIPVALPGGSVGRCSATVAGATADSRAVATTAAAAATSPTVARHPPPMPAYTAHPTAIIDADPPPVIGAGTTIWHWAHVASGAAIGAGASLGQGVYVAPGAVIGNRTRIQNGVSVYGGVTLGDRVFVGPGVVFTNVKHPRVGVPRRGEWVPTTVGDDASLGGGCVLVCGVNVGAGAFVGAGAVVTRDVPADTLVVGNPARAVSLVGPAGYRLAGVNDGEREDEKAGDDGRTNPAIERYECTVTGKRYLRRAGGRVVPEDDGVDGKAG